MGGNGGIQKHTVNQLEYLQMWYSHVFSSITSPALSLYSYTVALIKFQAWNKKQDTCSQQAMLWSCATFATGLGEAEAIPNRGLKLVQATTNMVRLKHGGVVIACNSSIARFFLGGTAVPVYTPKCQLLLNFSEKSLIIEINSDYELRLEYRPSQLNHQPFPKETWDCLGLP